MRFRHVALTRQARIPSLDTSINWGVCRFFLPLARRMGGDAEKVIPSGGR